MNFVLKSKVFISLIMTMAACYGSFAVAELGSSPFVFFSSSLIKSSQSGEPNAHGKYFDQILRKAKIKPVWVKETFPNQLKYLIENKVKACAPFFLKNKEREKSLKFTVPIGYYGDYVIVGRMDNKNLYEVEHLLPLFQSKLKGVLFKDSYFGAKLDKLIIEGNLNPLNATPNRIFASLVSGEYDYLFTSMERAKLILKNKVYFSKLKTFSNIRGIDVKNAIYIVCTKLVDDNEIEKMNNVIRTLEPVLK